MNEKSVVVNVFGLNFNVTNCLGGTLVAIAVFFLVWYLGRNVSLKPNKKQNLLEYLIDFTNGIVKERLAESDIAEKGFLLDGYPRTIEQAHALDETLKALGIKLDGVINIEVNPESLVERLSGRFICRSCGATYHKVFNPTKVEGTCDVCGEHEFFQREDDKPETVKRRLDVNIAQGEPIIAHYRELGLVSDIQGNQDIDDVFADVKKAIAAIK